MPAKVAATRVTTKPGLRLPTREVFDSLATRVLERKSLRQARIRRVCSAQNRNRILNDVPERIQWNFRVHWNDPRRFRGSFASRFEVSSKANAEVTECSETVNRTERSPRARKTRTFRRQTVHRSLPPAAQGKEEYD